MTAQRALAERQHRLLAMHLAICCWMGKCDAVILERQTFTNYLKLKTVKQARINQFEEDAASWFPQKHIFYRSGHTDSLHSIILSRIPIPKEVSKGGRTLVSTVECASKIGFRLAISKDLSPRYPEINENEVVAELAVWAAGLAAPMAVKSKIIKKPVVAFHLLQIGKDNH